MQACVTPAATPKVAAEAEVSEKALFLCRHGLTFRPELSRFPSGAQPADYLRPEDVSFLRDHPEWFSGAPVDAEGLTSCEVKSVTMFRDSISINLKRSVPPGAKFMSEGVQVHFLWTPVGWRASYWLPESHPSTPGQGQSVSDTRRFSEGEMTRPEKLSGPTVQYTAEALEQRAQGLLVVRCVLSREGTVRDCRVLKGVPSLTEPTLEVLRAARYKPVTFKGEPIDVDYTFHVFFHLPR